MQMRRSSQWLATPANALNCCRKGTQRNSRRGLAGALSPAFRLAVATVVVAIFRCFLTSKDARPAAQAQCKILSAPDLARTREWFDAAGAAINSRQRRSMPKPTLLYAWAYQSLRFHSWTTPGSPRTTID
jgi:hypothetical protein